jgi:DNA-binding transcriptional LysR family regulator
VDSMLTGSALAFRPLVETNSMATMTRLALAGAGAALMTDVTVAEEVKAGHLVHVPLSDRGARGLKLELLVRADRTLEPMAALVLDLLDMRFERYAGRP